MIQFVPRCVFAGWLLPHFCHLRWDVRRPSRSSTEVAFNSRKKRRVAGGRFFQSSIFCRKPLAAFYTARNPVPRGRKNVCTEARAEAVGPAPGTRGQEGRHLNSLNTYFLGEKPPLEVAGSWEGCPGCGATEERSRPSLRSSAGGRRPSAPGLFPQWNGKGGLLTALLLLLL